MRPPGILIDIPGLGDRVIHTVICDYTGTLSCRGQLVPGVKEQLSQLMTRVDLHVVTADSYGTAGSQLAGIVMPYRLQKQEGLHDFEKQEFAEKFALQHVAALGNGNNDRLLLKRVKEAGGLAIAVDNGEGCAVDAVMSAHLLIVGAVNALNLLLEPKGCKATLRF
jgi:soluble P-type ATPase